MKLNRKNIFLLDGAGAAASALSTVLVLPLFSEELGLSLPLLYGLALFPLMYGIYSLSCYQFVRKTKPWMLLAIVIANLVYCAITGAVIFLNDGITVWGQAVLATEIAVILGVVAIELKVYRETS